MTVKTTTLTAVLALSLGLGAAASAQETRTVPAPLEGSTESQPAAGAGTTVPVSPAAEQPVTAHPAPAPAAPAATPTPAVTPEPAPATAPATVAPVPVPAAGEPPATTTPEAAAAPGNTAPQVTGTADPAAGALTNTPAVGEAPGATPQAAAPVATPVEPQTPAAAEPTPAEASAAPAGEAAPTAAADAPAADAPATDAPAAEAPAADGHAAAPEGAAAPAAHHQEITDVSFSFEGPFGKFDQFQLQRGLQVYTEVCAACHGMRYVPIRTLGDAGGPGLPADQVRAYAANFEVEDAETGETRPGIPTDHFPHVTSAGAPDLSVMAKGRAGFHGPAGSGINQFMRGIGGPEYIYSVLTHYTGKTKEEAGETFYENTAFPGGWIKMPPPLSDDQVTYEDGHPATVSDEAKDVSAFLMWTAEPKMMARKQVGLISVIFLIGLTTLLYLTNKRLWWSVKHGPASRREV